MRASIFIFILLAGFFQATAREQTAMTRENRDSIFLKAAAERNDTLRSRYLRNAFQQYIGQPQGVEFLDSALALCVRKQLNKEELWTLFDYCRHYQYCNDIPNLERYFLKLKDASYRYKSNFAFYYTIWLAMLQIRCADGDTEYAILEAKEMRKEAERLKFEGGIFVSSLALAQAYSFAGQHEEAIAAYKQTLEEHPDANDDARLNIYGRMAEIYQKQKMYPEAVEYLQLRLDVLKKMLDNTPMSDSYKTLFMDIELSFSRTYEDMGNIEKMKEHLEKASQYYDKNTYFNTTAHYYFLWGNYYRLARQWDKCLHYYDLAMSTGKGSTPFFINNICWKKAKALMEAGRYEEAARTYRITALRADSLNEDILKRHEDVYRANYSIQNELIEKETLTNEYRWTLVGASGIILLSLIIAIVHVVRVRTQLRHSEEETRRAYETVKAADKMKDRFLHNITFEIRIPLNTVVGFSELLSSEKGLTESEIQEYSAVIKKNSVKLLSLINNILDLSRLEAGMMRFNVQENDFVQLCREAKMMAEMAQPEAVEVTFHTALEEQLIQVDSRWFLKLLTSLFAVPADYAGEKRQVEYTLNRNGMSLTIVVKGSPLYLCWEDEQEQRILHDINRLYVETFKGSYQVLENEGEKTVSITFPMA